MTWFNKAGVAKKSIKCPCCGEELISYFPSADHHPSQCIGCKAELFVLTIRDQNVCISTAHAPDEVRRFIKWSQREFDEIEFMSLVVFFEELAKTTK